MSLLITPSEVAWLLEQPRLPRVLDCRPREAYEQGHVPHAYNVDLSEVEPVETTVSGIYDFHASLDAPFRVLGRFEKVEVVVYGEGLDAASCRAFWIVQYTGLLGARLMAAGMPGWRGEGLPVTTEEPEIDPTPFAVRSRRELLARIDEVQAAVRDGRPVLLDARSPEEAEAGAIPGSVCYPAERFLAGREGALAPADRVRPALEEAGVTADRVIMPYSRRGGRSSLAWLALRSLGFRRVKNFLGGLAEWARQEA